MKFPLRIDCPACGLPVLIAEGRRDRVPLAFDTEPDGDGEHFDTILDDDLSRVRGVADGARMIADWRGRFTLYRSHFWTCPERLGCREGVTMPVSIGGYWPRREPGAPVGSSQRGKRSR